MKRYTLDPIPKGEDIHYINDLHFLYPNGYMSHKEHEEALNGKTKSQGGILPDDNMRIYVPLDLNARSIMHRLHIIFTCLGYPSDNNEMTHELAVINIISQLEIYDQIWRIRDAANATEKVIDGLTVIHSKQAVELAQQIVEYLEQQQSSADCFPYNIIDQLKETYWLEK